VAKARHITGEKQEGLFFAEVTIPNKKGLHARASAQFVRCASSFTATVRVTREGHTVGGTSIMGLMMLAAGQGHSILIEAEGEQAKEALAALVALVESGFGEDD
jgi:phosphocarrier protein HPr